MQGQMRRPRNESAVTLLPLSSTQQAFWFGQRLNPDSALYNIGGYIEIYGAVDPAIFERALRQAVAGADGLSLQFIETQDRPQQYFNRDIAWDMPVFDVSREADPRAAAEAWMSDDLARVFDLTRGPLFRFALLKAGDDRFYWYGAYHHLVNDFSGSLLIERRVADLYSRLVGGTGPTTDDPGSWLDLLDEDESYRLSPRLQRDQDYWRGRLVDRPDVTTLSGRPPA